MRAGILTSNKLLGGNTPKENMTVSLGEHGAYCIPPPAFYELRGSYNMLRELLPYKVTYIGYM